MPKLNQIIAIEKGIGTKTRKLITSIHHMLVKKDLFVGHSKNFTPIEDDPSKPTGEKLPQDNMRVKYKALDLIKDAKKSWTEFFNITFMRDYGNTSAAADVVVDDKVLLEKVPVSYLLFLEKQLDDVHTFMSKLPVLDSSEDWEFDPNQDMFATKPTTSIKTKKVLRPFVLYEATTEHPAQVKEVSEDVMHGTWKTIKYSTALPAKTVNEIVERIEKLQQAIKFAREKANEKDVDKKEVGKQIFDYILENKA
jgi:hypothetical protein